MNEINLKTQKHEEKLEKNQASKLDNSKLSQMSNHERFMRTMRYQEVDRRPLDLVEPWFDTLTRWRQEGLPDDVEGAFGSHLRFDNKSGDIGTRLTLLTIMKNENL